MFDGPVLSFRFVIRLLFAFGLLSVAAAWLYPLYAPCVTWFTARLWQGLSRGEHVLTLTTSFPSIVGVLAWNNQQVTTSVSFYLVAYNAILYGALLLAFPNWSWQTRGLLAVTGIPFLFAYHCADLLLAIENQRLTATQAQHYQILKQFDVWFSMVKFCHSLNVFAGKQVFPLLLLMAQWHLLTQWQRTRG